MILDALIPPAEAHEHEKHAVVWKVGFRSGKILAVNNPTPSLSQCLCSTCMERM